ncbi:MAG: winged helix-turn-helix domain-containing protein [Acidobacteriota bacterium]
MQSDTADSQSPVSYRFRILGCYNPARQLFRPAMDLNSGRIVRFGVFEMDTAAAELRKNGARIRLQEQPARVLLHLLKHRGEIVTREELHRALWPEDTFVDFDHGLNTTINKIRDALGDSATSARFVETVPKKGYRFVAPVEEGAPLHVEPAPAPVAPPPRRSSRWLWAAGGVAAISVAVAGLLAPRWSTSLPEPTVVPLTTLPGLEYISSLSPDGERAAFSWSGADNTNTDIYVKQVGSESILRLTTDPAYDGNPAWSPDGQWIAFSRRSAGGSGELYLIPATGGAETKLTDISAGYDSLASRIVSWAPNGKWMMISDGVAQSKNLYALYSFSLETHQKRQLTFPPETSFGDLDSAISPDGRSVAFVRRYSGQLNELFLLRLTAEARADGQPFRLLPRSRTYRSPTWTADGKELVFQSGWFHLPSLSRLRLGEAASVPIALTGEFAGSPSISARGNRMSFRRGANDINIWALKLGGTGGPRREPWGGSSTYLDHVPHFSPDGRRVAFVSNRAGSQALWVSDADGSHPARLTNFTDAEVTGGSWMPGGTALAAMVLTESGTKSYRIGLGGEPPAELHFPGHVSIPFIASRDAKSWFLTSKKTGQWEIWKAPASGGLPVQITKKGGQSPQESPDGRYLYYVVSETHPSLWRVPADGGTEEKVLDSLVTPMSFQVMEEGIYYIPEAGTDGHSSIRLHRFATGKAETLADLDKPVMWGFSVSPDRKTILYVQIDHFSQDQMLVENFR